VYQICSAETYEARHRLVYDRRSDCPPFKYGFLYEALEQVNEADDGLYLSDFSPADEHRHIIAPFFNDSDHGPVKMWKWAHKDETCRNFVYQGNRQYLRDWGYVMWDLARLEDLGVFEKAWDIDDACNASRLASEEELRHVAEMETSWEQRSRIYRAGGRGWWSVGDGSRIVWASGKAPRQQPYGPVRVTPISVEHARDTLRMMMLPSPNRSFLRNALQP
jgi:hypothetical protein